MKTDNELVIGLVNLIDHRDLPTESIRNPEIRAKVLSVYERRLAAMQEPQGDNLMTIIRELRG